MGRKELGTTERLTLNLLTSPEMYPFNRFLSIQCVIVHWRYSIVQQISRACSFPLTETLCLLISNSEFSSPVSQSLPAIILLSVSMILTILGTSHQWSFIVFAFL